MLATFRGSITEFAAKEGLPPMYPWRTAVEAGGLISYGTDLDELRRRAAWYVDPERHKSPPTYRSSSRPSLSSRSISGLPGPLD
jgi:putative ABC transport system substrate-binding protein